MKSLSIKISLTLFVCCALPVLAERSCYNHDFTRCRRGIVATVAAPVYPIPVVDDAIDFSDDVLDIALGRASYN